MISTQVSVNMTSRLIGTRVADRDDDFENSPVINPELQEYNHYISQNHVSEISDCMNLP